MFQSIKIGKPNSSTVPSKRERSSKACISCHNKKIKCNLDKVPSNTKCQNCQSSNLECLLYVRKKRASSKNSSSIIDNKNFNSFPNNKKRHLSDNNNNNNTATDKINITSNNTSNSSPSSNSNHIPNRKHSILNSNFSSLDSHTDVKSTSSIPKFPTSFPNHSKHNKYPHLSAISLDPNLILKENLCDLMITEFGINGESNNLMKKIFNKALNKITEDHKRSYSLDSFDLEVLQSFGCFSIPDESTCWKYIDNFFEFINPQLPIIDKTNFYQNYTNLQNPPSLLLLFSILYVGSWHESNDPTKQIENVEISQILFKRATLIYQYSIETEPIALIQSLLCFSFNNGNMSNIAKNSYYWCHAAINICYQYGIHLKPSSDLNQYEKKIRKRLWWILYFKDRLTCFGYSRPSIINLNQSDHSMINLSDLSDTGMTPLESLYLINLVKFGKLIDKIGSIQQEITKLYLDGKPTLNLIKKCDLIMIKYLNNIPKELKFKFNDKSTHSFLSLMILSQYYTLLIVIHKANILRHATDIYPSWAISFQAVQIIKMMSDCLVAKNLISKVAFVSHNSLTTSALIMSYHLINEDPKISKIAKDSFLRIMGIWRQSYTKFPNCYPMLCIFATIYDSEDYLKQIVKSVVPNENKYSFNPKGRNKSKSKHHKIKIENETGVEIKNENNIKTENDNDNDNTLDNKDELNTRNNTNNYSGESENSTNEEKLEEKKKINLPDLSLLATGELEIKNLKFNTNFTNFEHLGVDFDKLFTESVFTNGDNLLPKLDLESIGNPKPISLENNSLNNINNKKENIDGSLLKPPISSNDKNILNNHRSIEMNQNNNISNSSSHDNNNINESFLEFKNLNFSNTPDINLDSNNPIVPDANIPISLWMMKTNWQPKFNLEQSDSSFDNTTPSENMFNHEHINMSTNTNPNIPNNQNTHPISTNSPYFSNNDENVNYRFKKINENDTRAENIFYANSYQIMGGKPKTDYNTSNNFNHQEFDNNDYNANIDNYPHVYAYNDSWHHKQFKNQSIINSNSNPNSNSNSSNVKQNSLSPYYSNETSVKCSLLEDKNNFETKKFNSYYNQTQNLHHLVYTNYAIHGITQNNVNNIPPQANQQWIPSRNEPYYSPNTNYNDTFTNINNTTMTTNNPNNNQIMYNNTPSYELNPNTENRHNGDPTMYNYGN
ncbi:hypothetical protein DAPK24_002000 [Pichia kluyveri]|uniref:Zn(2)-C6 fungal-type domain-containing protein n=1 Tax=Pichia kluyveri TaxID=36015 RepID=A0AAV5QXE8_PICKL|nr:hypothetical protein DAPK24_002000 [Pichia kluyveri]